MTGLLHFGSFLIPGLALAVGLIFVHLIVLDERSLDRRGVFLMLAAASVMFAFVLWRVAS